MADLSILAGATSQSVNVFIQDTRVGTGAGLTGLVFNTAGLTAYYSFSGAVATATSITLATLALITTAYSSGGFKEIDATNMPGWYRLDLPNAALATAKGRQVSLHLQGAANMAPCVLKIELTAVDNQAALLTAAQIATGVWQDATAADFTAASSIGKSLYTSGNVPGAASGLLISGTNAGTTTFGAMTCTGSFTISDGLLISRSSANTSAFTATGNGTGSGAVFTSGSGATGDGVKATAASTNGNGITYTGTGTGNGSSHVAGATGSGLKTSATAGNGIHSTGNGGGHGIYATSASGSLGGNGLQCEAISTNGHGARFLGNGTGSGFRIESQGTGNGLLAIGGSTSGAAISATTTAGDGLSLTPTAGNAITATANGTSKHGIVATGGTAGTSDGIKGAAGTGGVDIRGNITGNVTGNVSGSVGSLTTNNDKTGYALSSAGVQAIWDALTSALTTVGSIGKLLVDNINATISSRLPTSSYTAPLDAAGTRSAVGLASANLDTQLSAIAGYIDTEVGTLQTTATAIKTQTDKLTFTVANQIDANVLDWKSATAPAMTGDAYARLGAPAGASVSADVAAVKTDTAAVKTKTDSLTFTVAGQVDANAESMNATTILGTGTSGDLWRG
jgi:hypothetical protein